VSEPEEPERPDPKTASEIKLDRRNLYREETITDLRVGSIQRLTPIKPDGKRDEAREVLYVGQTQIMSQAGMIPVSARIEALDLEDALRKFPQAMQKAIENLVDEVNRLRREQMSRIVVPGRDVPGPKIIT
jgi:hypothetical protein